jgi:uncharacterized protein YegP (UPF0339 family)
MKKWLAGAVLATGLGVLSFPTDGVWAQAKKTEDKKMVDKKATTSAGGSVTINEGKDGKFRFQVRNADDKFICLSGAYATEKDAIAAVEELKAVLAVAKVTVSKEKAKDKN